MTARLIERLEGGRPSYRHQPGELAPEVQRVCKDHVRAAVAEYREMSDDRDVSRQVALLEDEVLRTVAPRYTELAAAFNQAEQGGFGLGLAATPLGRLGLVAATLFVVWFVLLKMISLPVVWPLMLLVLAVPFSPDLAAWVTRRRYHAELRDIVADMTRIQEQALAYVPPEQLQVEDDPPRRRTRVKEG